MSQSRRLQLGFEFFAIQQIPKSRNIHANSLTTLATSSGQDLTRVILVEDLYRPAEEKKERVEVHQIKVEPNWKDPLVLFMKEGVLPHEKGKAGTKRRKTPCFWLSEEQKLYKCFFFGPYLLCVHPKAVEPLLEELHEGICGSYTGGRSLSHRALTQGYWWPSM